MGVVLEISLLLLHRGPAGFAEISVVVIRAELPAPVEKSGGGRA
jgi:hypothetical protein